MSGLYNNNLKDIVSKYREGNASTFSEMEFGKSEMAEEVVHHIPQGSES
jgi:hypothetical protein